MDGKCFVDGMSKAFFQCTLATWKALNDKHNSGESFVFFCTSAIPIVQIDCTDCTTIPIVLPTIPINVNMTKIMTTLFSLVL